MEFKSLRNIESSFRQIRLFGIVFLSLCAVVTVWSVWNSYRFAEKQREKIYVLDNGKSLMLGSVSGFVAEPPGGGTGACAPLPRAFLHAVT
jgi:ABC-type glucose/galactose transport system permease subunit